MRGDCRERLAIQMYTVHEHAWANLEETLQALANMGYRGIEYYGHHSMFDRNVTAQMEARTGMKMIGWHTEWADLQEDTYEETVSYLEAVGCPLIVVPCLGGRLEHRPQQRAGMQRCLAAPFGLVESTLRKTVSQRSWTGLSQS